VSASRPTRWVGASAAKPQTALHYAGPNTSTEPRRALIMGFSAPPTLLPEPRHMPWQRPEWYA
jgi:hypothetical protein